MSYTHLQIASYNSGLVLRFSVPIDPNFPGIIFTTGKFSLEQMSTRSCNLYAVIGRIGADIFSINQ